MNIFKQYTPTSINDIVFADQHSKQLIDDIVCGALPFPITQGKCGILLYGISGTGKSALAELLPDAIEEALTGEKHNSYKRYVKVQPGNNGLTMLQKISNQSELVPFVTHHYFVLDEVDNLNDAAMLILKSVMNAPNCVFILTTNHFNKIDSGVKSRCHCIPFNAAPAANWLPLAQVILSDAGVNAVPNQLLVNVIETCKGDARDILTAVYQLGLQIKRNQAKLSQ